MLQRAGNSGQVQRTARHRPQLSLDPKLIRKQLSSKDIAQRSPSQSNGRPSRPESASTLQRGGDATPDTLARLRSFVKVSGSVRDHDSVKERCSSGQRKAIAADGISSPRPLGSLKLPISTEDSGPLLTYSTISGAKVTLTLDRHIQYEADPAAVSAWDYRNCNRAMSCQNLFSPSPLQANPFSDDQVLPSVPRSLLCFTLTLEPFQGEAGNGPKENIEFLSLQLDFKVPSVPSVAQSQRYASSPTVGKSRPFDNSYTAGGLQTSSSIRPAVVRGFAPSDLMSSNFLQEYGPTLYQTLHQKEGATDRPVVLGSGQEARRYRNFELRMAQLSKPLISGGDKFTARSAQAMASAPPTPASSTFRQSSAPFTPLDVEAAEYGTSSVRLMVKRDVESDDSWATRKFPFLILLEHPKEAPRVEVSTKVDLTTVRKSVQMIESPRMSILSPGLRSSRPSHSSTEGTDPGYESSGSRYRSLGFPSRRPGMHGRTMSETSNRSSSMRNVEDIDVRTTLFPRSDPISVISAGLGTVKDTLFQTGLAPKESTALTPSRTGSSRPIENSTAPRTPRSLSSPYLNKPLPVPIKNAPVPVPALPTKVPRRPSPRPLYKHSKSAASIPSMLKRDTSFGNSQEAKQSRSYGSSSSEGSIYSQGSLRESGRLGRSVPKPLAHGHTASVGSTITKHVAQSPDPLLLPVTSRPRLDSIPVMQQEESDGEIFDMVLTNWQATKMDREPIYALPRPELAHLNISRKSKNLSR